MNSFNTIEVSANPVTSHHASEQRGLIGPDADFFDDDKDQIRSKKMKISDAIEN